MRRACTVDFVSVRHLPAVRSFSSHDDSLDEDSLESEVLERLRRKRGSQDDVLDCFERSDVPLQSKSEDNILRCSAIGDEKKGRNEYLVAEGDDGMLVSTLERVQQDSTTFCTTFQSPTRDGDEHAEDVSMVTEDNLNSDVQPIEGLDPTIVSETKERKSSPELEAVLPVIDEVSGKNSATVCEMGEHLPLQTGADLILEHEEELVPDKGAILSEMEEGSIICQHKEDILAEESVIQLEANECTAPTYPKVNLAFDETLADKNVTLLSAMDEEIYCDSSTCSDVTYSRTTTSETQLFETHLVLTDEEEEDTLGQLHVQEVYLTINSEGSLEEDGQPQHPFYSYKLYRTSSADDGSATTEGETICDDLSLNEGMDLLEDITEQTEGFSEDETAPVCDETPLPVAPKRTVRRHRTYLELDVSGGHITEKSVSSASVLP